MKLQYGFVYPATDVVFLYITYLPDLLCLMMVRCVTSYLLNIFSMMIAAGGLNFRLQKSSGLNLG